MMARRKISLGELAEKIDITPANLSILKTGKAEDQKGKPVISLHLFIYIECGLLFFCPGDCGLLRH